MRPTQFNLGEFGGGVFAEFETNLRRERQWYREGEGRWRLQGAPAVNRFGTSA
jgi:hypothetical protein